MAARKREFVCRIKNSLNERILQRFPSFSSPNASRLSVGVVVVGVGCAGCLAWCVQQPTEEKHALPFTSLRHFGESKTKRGIFYDVVKCETTKGTSDGSAVKSVSFVFKCISIYTEFLVQLAVLISRVWALGQLGCLVLMLCTLIHVNT